ncbi:unnamed protein product [Dovyalis caffra]|uniref:Polygalacturonase n=1 Tax=Dovyalis caffra TaxID=77055 RepID=A0AAV1SP68_9ROSI|nr:unnamed protein product [Dovyalis caffra]
MEESSILRTVVEKIVENTFNVLNFGAIGDGTTDDSQAFVKAWEALCGANGSTPTLDIPAKHTFLLKPLKFNGPCKSNSVHIQLSGKIVAPNTIDAWGGCGIGEWLGFHDIKSLNLYGSGEIDGQGSVWWQNEKKGGKCERPEKTSIPPVLIFEYETYILMKILPLNFNSLHVYLNPRIHIGILDCTDVLVSNLHITAPEDSPNTDGMDISRSTHVRIQNSTIGTGDDCIAVNGGCYDVKINNIACGPGHGISVGSLGQNGVKDTVEEVHVWNCSFNGTQNAARIKTWQGGSGYARKISYDQITLIASHNPIIIDQYYCNGASNCRNASSAVTVSEITYRGFQGTSAGEEAIKLNCCNLGCDKIVMDQINIVSSAPGKQTHALCEHANGTSKATIPDVACLTKSGY